jgi:hypothetical protein
MSTCPLEPVLRLNILLLISQTRTSMGVSVSVTVHLFLEIRAHHGRWKDSILSPLFIRISKQNGR